MNATTDRDGRGLASVAVINHGIDLTASATGAAAQIAPSLAAQAGRRMYVTSFQVTGAGATAASVVTAVLSGTIGGDKSYQIAVPASATTGITPLIVTFPRPIPASADNTAITLTVPSFGAGNTKVAASIDGFHL